MSLKQKYWHEEIGSNYRITNIQCAIGFAQLSRIEKLLKKRRKIFQYYDYYLKNNKKLNMLPRNNWSTNSFWLYTVVIKDIGIANRNKLIDNLNKAGIETRNGFYNLSEMKIYQKYSKYKCYNARYLSSNTLSLPTYINLTKYQIKYICENLLLNINKLKI